MKIPVEQIQIGERQRIELGDLTDLDSMQEREVGLICPIIVHRTSKGYELVDGMRRLSKAKQLGWTEIEVFEKDTLTPAQKELCEFFADVARKDRTWQEQCTATYKLFHMLKFEKREEGQVWTIRSMEKFCGMSRNEVHYRLKVAEGLLAEPRDEELWTSDNVSSAQKLLIARANKATAAEMERRRLRAAQAQVLTGAVPVVEVVTVTNEDGEIVSIESPVLNEDTTAALDLPMRVQLFGRNREFDGKETGFFLALAYKGTLHENEHLMPSIRDDAYAVLCNNTGYLPANYQLLYWNKVKAVPSKYPFYANIEHLFIEAKTPRTEQHPNASSGVWTSMDFSGDTELGYQITQALVNALTEPGQSVLCVGGVNPNDVASCGRIPVWYEPNLERYAAKLESLKEQYKEIYPNVEFFE